MHHIVQANLFNETGFTALVGELEDQGLPYTVVKVVPFAHTLEPDISPEGPVMVWGATTLGHIAAERGWKPGQIQNEKFDMRYLKQRFGPYFLNDDAEFCAFGDLQFEGRRFIRPVHDSKTFSGTVMDNTGLVKWQQQVLDVSDGYSTLRVDTPAMHASLKELTLEARFFVVEGRVVTGSLYRFEGRPAQQRRVDGNPVFKPLEEFARKMLLVDCSRKELTPVEPIAQAYALDVAQVEGGDYTVVEINTINSSGFYACNMSAVIRALEAMQLQAVV
jgi:hypothetical protein